VFDLDGPSDCTRASYDSNNMCDLVRVDGWGSEEVDICSISLGSTQSPSHDVPLVILTCFLSTPRASVTNGKKASTSFGVEIPARASQQYLNSLSPAGIFGSLGSRDGDGEAGRSVRVKWCGRGRRGTEDLEGDTRAGVRAGVGQTDSSAGTDKPAGRCEAGS